MEDKNNCPMDPFLENSKEEDEEVFIALVFSSYQIKIANLSGGGGAK